MDLIFHSIEYTPFFPFFNRACHFSSIFPGFLPEKKRRTRFFRIRRDGFLQNRLQNYFGRSAPHFDIRASSSAWLSVMTPP